MHHHTMTFSGKAPHPYKNKNTFASSCFHQLHLHVLPDTHKSTPTPHLLLLILLPPHLYPPFLSLTHTLSPPVPLSHGSLPSSTMSSHRFHFSVPRSVKLLTCIHCFFIYRIILLTRRPHVKTTIHRSKPQNHRSQIKTTK